jgi:hypothetical protein
MPLRRCHTSRTPLTVDDPDFGLPSEISTTVQHEGGANASHWEEAQREPVPIMETCRPQRGRGEVSRRLPQLQALRIAPKLAPRARPAIKPNMSRQISSQRRLPRSVVSVRRPSTWNDVCEASRTQTGSARRSTEAGEAVAECEQQFTDQLGRQYCVGVSRGNDSTSD